MVFVYSPKYTITTSILSNIGKIEAAKEIIENAALVPAWEAKFKTDALVRTVHHGTHIEGNQLTRDEAARVVEAYSPVDEPWMVASKASVQAKDRDIQEVINYRNVMSYLDEVYESQKNKYAERVLKKLKVYHKNKYHTLDGWDQDISSINKKKDLPNNCLSYINFIEKLLKVKTKFISTGPERNQIIKT